MAPLHGIRTAAAVLAIALGLLTGPVRGAEHPFPKRTPAAEFPADLEWFNTDRPLTLADLRGKFVLLDFWTYCCINCMHILPELARLEAAFPEDLVVIGVHSAKFAEERLGDNIRAAILRHRIAHPVVNDADHAIWNRYRVDTWPSLRVIDPEGNVIAAQAGEVEFEQLERFFRGAIAHYRQAGTLEGGPLALPRERIAAPAPLRFPGKLLFDEAGRRLFIADSGHDRIVVADIDIAGGGVSATLAATIGSGRTGAADGGFEQASFNQPQGLALEPAADGASPTTLLVADTENHLLRRVRLANRSVETIAGTGRQSRSVLLGMQPARATPLNSPWDLLVHGGQIYVAMAGPHQIWRLPQDATVIGVHAGNGREDVVDGPLLPKKPFATGAASFAQPSGLATDGEWLYVADSEGSSIRAVPLAAKGENAAAPPSRRVRTVVGTSRLPRGRLFTFGDVDGPAETARLQHPLGVSWLDGRLFVADTYNHKIKAVDPATGAVRTVSGSGRRGTGDDPAEFAEPAGIAVGVGLLWIADTNNHAIRVVDPATGATRTLAIRGLEPPAHVTAEPPPDIAERPAAGVPLPGSPLAGFGDAQEVDLGRVRGTIVATDAGRVARIVVVATPPEGWKLNDMSPVRWRLEPAAPGGVAPPKPPAGRTSAAAPRPGEFTIDLPLAADAAAGASVTPLVLTVDAILCESKGTTCRPSSIRARLALELAAPPAPAPLAVPLP